MVHHHVHRIALGFEKGEGGLQQRPRPLATERGQNDKAGVKLRAAGQSPEVAPVLGDDDAILGNAGRKDSMIRLAAPSDVERMNGIVPARGVQPHRELRRQTLVDEQPHTPRTQGRPPGRPTKGWVRA